MGWWGCSRVRGLPAALSGGGVCVVLHSRGLSKHTCIGSFTTTAPPQPDLGVDNIGKLGPRRRRTDKVAAWRAFGAGGGAAWLSARGALQGGQQGGWQCRAMACASVRPVKDTLISAGRGQAAAYNRTVPQSSRPWCCAAARSARA